MATDFRLKEQLPDLTEQIVETYTKCSTTQYLGHTPLPRFSEVISIMEDLTDIIFPGYRRREGLHIGNVTYHVGQLIDGLHDKLTRQIARALMHQQNIRTENKCAEMVADFEAQGQAIAIKFLDKIPELRRLLSTDVDAAFVGDPACKSHEEVIFCYPGVHAITAHRIAHELYRLEVPIIPRMISEHSHGETGIDIHPGASIGEHFFIDHGTGVVIGETCEIGAHCKIYQGVTLGAISFPMDADGRLIRGAKRHPTVEDHVVIYANATVLGGKTLIGKNSIVGSSVWLTKSVEPFTTVLNETPKLRLKNEAPDLNPEHNYQI
ncbi:MAG: serine acetyltransferase [Pirellulaceae bacterium]|nr:serine acetyltransferase [Pirellulaceae bacterium]